MTCVPRPRCCSTTTSTAAFGPHRSRAGGGDRLRGPARPPTSRSSRRGSSRPPTPAPWSATWRPSPTPWASCRPPRRWPGRRRVRRGPGARTVSSTPRCATRRSCTSSGDLELPDVVEAVNAGFREGERRAAEAGHPIRVGALLTAMRHAARSLEIAELAVRYRDDGVVGFDIAGAEAGNPPTRHLDAFEYLQRENAHFTIHAGEGVRAAVDLAGHPVVRRRPARPRRAHHRRHHRRPGRRRRRWAGSRPTSGTSASRSRWPPRPTS